MLGVGVILSSELWGVCGGDLGVCLCVCVC